MPAYDKGRILGMAVADLSENPALAMQVASIVGRWGAARYDSLKELALERSFWRFAMMDIAGSAITPTTRYTTEDWQYVYQRPASCVRFIGVSETPKYAVLHDHIYTDKADATLVYVENVDEDRFPATFREYFVKELQAQMVHTVTNDQGLLDYYDRKAVKMMVIARTIDSSQSVTKTISDALSRVLKTPTSTR